jgi:hypothetical protein
VRVNGIRGFLYFHHYFEPPETPGLHLYNLSVGIRNFTVGFHWAPFRGRNYGDPDGFHVWLCVPLVSLMLAWVNPPHGEKGRGDE